MCVSTYVPLKYSVCHMQCFTLLKNCFHMNVYLDIVNPIINGPDQFGFSTFPIMIVLLTNSRHMYITELFSIKE